MKKLFMFLMFMPFMAFAENTSKASINYVDFNFDGVSFDGWGASFDSAMNDKVIWQLDWFKLEDVDFSVISGAYAFSSLAEGSAYLGFARFDSDLADSADTELEVGYARIGGESLDFSVGLINSEDDLTFRGEIHTPSGVSLGILTDGDVDLINIGYHVKF
jgi:hypothetical protein